MSITMKRLRLANQAVNSSCCLYLGSDRKRGEFLPCVIRALSVTQLLLASSGFTERVRGSVPLRVLIYDQLMLLLNSELTITFVLQPLSLSVIG